MTGTRITQLLKTLEDMTIPGAKNDYRFGPKRDFTLRIAASEEDRRKAWALAYATYRGKGYAAHDPASLWYSLFDALPETTTFLAERAGRPVATLTIVFDGPLGLPADELYRAELDVLRGRNRTICEITSLVSTESESAAGVEVVKHLFKLAYVAAHHASFASDFVITVNPRHIPFYRRVLRFDAAGGERPYAKVGGAPAELLRLDLVTAADRYRIAFGGRPGTRDIHRFFLDGIGDLADWIRRERRLLSPEDFRKWFVKQRPLLAEAPAPMRAWLEDYYGIGVNEDRPPRMTIPARVA